MLNEREVKYQKCELKTYSLEEFRNKFNEKIKKIEDLTFLTEMDALIENKILNKNGFEISEERWNIINERRRKYLSGEEKAFTPEQGMANIKEKYFNTTT